MIGFFVNMIINLGFVGGLEGVFVGFFGGFGYNLCGFKRDIGLVMNQCYVNWIIVFIFFFQFNIDVFCYVFEGVFYIFEIGFYGGMYYNIGGDFGGDFFIFFGDFVFWVYYGQMDCMWVVWQVLGFFFSIICYIDLGFGFYVYQSWVNEFFFFLIFLIEVFDMGYVVLLIIIVNVMFIIGGEFCYFYFQCRLRLCRLVWEMNLVCVVDV